MILNNSVRQAAWLLRHIRRQRGISQRQLADGAGVNVSLVRRAERGLDARLSTWSKLFQGAGHYLLLDTTESCEEAGDLLSEEAERRRDRQRWGRMTRI